MTRSLRTHPVALAALVYAVLTVAYTWPLPRHLFDGVAHDLGDPLLNTWILWWSTKAVPLTPAWWNAPSFYPAAGVLAFSEHLLGLAWISMPLIALSGSPLFAYNVALLASYVGCALGAHFLAFTLTRRHDASFVAGLAFACAPYRLAQVPHIQVMTSFWTPLCLAALHRFDDRIRGASGDTVGRGWALTAAAAWYIQSMANGYFFFFLSVLIGVWLVWFAAGRWSVKQTTVLAVPFAVAAVLFVPVLLGYSHILTGMYGFSRGRDVVTMYSADIASLLQASDDLWLWGWIHVVRKPEGDLFPGPAIAVLALCAVLAARPFSGTSTGSSSRRWLRRSCALLAVIFFLAAFVPFMAGRSRITVAGIRVLSIGRADAPLLLGVVALVAWMATLPAVTAAFRRRSPLMFYVLAATVTWTLALGPDPTFLGRTGLSHAPYGWLMHLPGGDGLRVPARFWTMSLACLSVLAAYGVTRIPARRRVLLVTVAAAAVVLDGWPRAFLVVAAPERRPTPADVALRVDLPMNDDRDVEALYQQTFDGVGTYNGYSGYAAPHQYAMRELLRRFDPRILGAMTARGSLGVVVDHAMDPNGSYRKFVQAYPGAALVETHAAWSSYRLPAGPKTDLVPDVAGTPLPIKALTAFPSQPHAARAIDGDLATRWSGGVQRSAADFTIELEQPSRVAQLVVALGPFPTDFPARLRLEVSGDRASWDTVFDGDTALHAYYAAVRHPKEVPVVYPIGRDAVRFIRMTQLGWGDHDWSIAELHVLR